MEKRRLEKLADLVFEDKKYCYIEQHVYVSRTDVPYQLLFFSY